MITRTLLSSLVIPRLHLLNDLRGSALYPYYSRTRRELRRVNLALSRLELREGLGRSRLKQINQKSTSGLSVLLEFNVNLYEQETCAVTMSTGGKMGKIVLGAAEVAYLKEASRRIFGHLPQLNTGKTGNKILRKPLIGDKLVTYFPATINKIAHREWFGYKTDMDIWRENRLLRMHARGNPPTKKGEGKRAQQAKKKK